MSFDANETKAMSILTTQQQSSLDDEPFTLFGDRTSVSFVKRDTRFLNLVPKEVTKVKKTHQEFCTGSSYVGEWHVFGFCGQGTYFYPHGVEYEGRFNKNGQFHGLGTLIYPNGQRVQGVWKNGKLFEYAYVFNCGEEIDENFTYCKMPDRRFFVEGRKYFGPTGLEYLTADQPTVDLPEKSYDVGYGIYDPKRKMIMSHKPRTAGTVKYKISPVVESCRRKLSDEFMLNGRMIVEIPRGGKVKWIKKQCRREWDEATGYRPDLYETWNSGRRRDTDTPIVEVKPSRSSGKVLDPIKPEAKTNFFTFIKKVNKPVTDRFSMFGMRHTYVPPEANSKT